MAAAGLLENQFAVQIDELHGSGRLEAEAAAMLEGDGDLAAGADFHTARYESPVSNVNGSRLAEEGVADEPFLAGAIAPELGAAHVEDAPAGRYFVAYRGVGWSEREQEFCAFAELHGGKNLPETGLRFQFLPMTIAAAKIELLELSRKLSPKKRREWVEFGRQLYANKTKKAPAVTEDGDAAWEKIIADPNPRPKLAAVAAKIRAEMQSGKHFPAMRVEDL